MPPPRTRAPSPPSRPPPPLAPLTPNPVPPAEIRGAFRSIETAAPGLRICEHLPGLARLADKYIVVRSLGHGECRHDEAVHLMLTGRESPGADPGATCD